MKNISPIFYTNIIYKNCLALYQSAFEYSTRPVCVQGHITRAVPNRMTITSDEVGVPYAHFSGASDKKRASYTRRQQKETRYLEEKGVSNDGARQEYYQNCMLEEKPFSCSFSLTSALSTFYKERILCIRRRILDCQCTVQKGSSVNLLPFFFRTIFKIPMISHSWDFIMGCQESYERWLQLFTEYV